MIRATLALLLLMTADDPKPPTPDVQVRILSDRYQAEFDQWVKVSEAAKTPEDEAKLRTYPSPDPRKSAIAFMELARKNPGTPAAEDALLWVATHVFFNSDCQETQRLLVKDFARSAKLGPALGFSRSL